MVDGNTVVKESMYWRNEYSF